MVKDLGLSGNDLICYALIYGFTQDGKYWNKSHSYIAEWLGVSKRSVSEILKRLVDMGLLLKQEHEFNNVKMCSYIAVTENFIGSEETSSGGSEETSLHRNNYYNKEKKEIDKSISKKEFENAFIERMYKLYPTKCPKRNASLGKSHKDKQRIAKLLKKYSMEDIELVFKREIEEKYDKQYMQNFSTFLNNFPDPTSIEQPTLFTINDNDNTTLSNEKIIINGQIYR